MLVIHDTRDGQKDLVDEEVFDSSFAIPRALHAWACETPSLQSRKALQD